MQLLFGLQFQIIFNATPPKGAHRGAPQEPRRGRGESGAPGVPRAGREGELPRGLEHVPEHFREQLPEQELGQDGAAEHCHHTG